MPDDLYQKLCFQVGRLELNARYPAEINILLSSQKASLEMNYAPPGNAAQVAKLLKENALSYEKSFGLNDWRTALMHSLADNNDFCDGGFRNVLG